MLVRLMYVSRASQSVSQEMLNAILATSRANNPPRGITGVLCSSGQIFLQALEGGRMEINALYNRITTDPRHREVVLLCYEEIEERRFANWAMGQVSLARINPSLLIKYSATAVLDPYAVSGKASMALFNELIATASIMGQCSSGSAE